MTVPDVVVVGVAVVVVVTVLILVLTVVVAATMDLVVVGGVEVALPLHISPAYAPAAGVLPAWVSSGPFMKRKLLSKLSWGP